MLAIHNSCTGCSACVQSCPYNAITMKLNSEGFFYPNIDSQKCNTCGQCESVCPIINNQKCMRWSEPKAYACFLKDSDEIYNSTSGGAFYALGKAVIQAGGGVWGAVLKSDLCIEHQYADTIEKLSSLRKSKYVQSNLKNTFKEVRRLLEDEKLILFSGTPCQCAGLSSYLHKNYENLLLVEVFCAQITGYLSWQKYLEERKAEHNAMPSYLEFRKKTTSDLQEQNGMGLISGGWKDPHIAITYDNGDRESEEWQKDEWTIAFRNHMMSGRSCSNCKFKQQSQYGCADLAIGDFWGVENNAPHSYNSAGTSAMLVYTERGMAWLETLQNDMNIFPVSVPAIKRGNPYVWKSIKPHKNRDIFLKKLHEKKDFSYVLKECLGADETQSLNLRFGVFGGFNLRRAVLDVCDMCSSKLAFHISNINLLSLMSQPVVQPLGMQLPVNPLRADMLKLDFNKTLFTMQTKEMLKNIDYFVIDFMEERFCTLSYNNSYITCSDALKDSSFTDTALELTPLDVWGTLWQEKCLAFISCLYKYYQSKQLILVRSFLSTQYEDCNGKLVEFEDNLFPYSIASMNQLLEKEYDFFLENYSAGNVIILDRALDFCEYNHKHGIMPSHSNAQSCAGITQQLYDIICKKQK